MRKPRCKSLYEKNKYYHVYNRGHRKSLVFREVEDYNYFCQLMQKYLKFYDIVVLEYCLMPNHYHFLFKLGESVSEIPKFMQRFMTAYGIFFNRKYGLVGSVFQSPFGCRKIDGYGDLLNMIEYIKNNPVEARLVSDPNDYKWLFINKRSFKVLLRLGLLDAKLFDEG